MKLKSSILFNRFMRCYTLLVFLCFVTNTQGQSFQQDSLKVEALIVPDTSLPISNSYEKLNKNFIINGVKDGIAMATAPLHWQKNDWIKFSVLTGGVAGLMIFDKKIKSVFLRNQNNFTSSVASVAEPVGNVYGLLVFPAVYFTGLATHNPRIESIGLRGSKAMAISSVLCFAGKNIIRRQRPDASATPFNYALPFAKSRYTSFPSAHSSIAFTLATAFALEFPDKKWVAPVAYSIASLTSISRIYHNRHWASDVLVGAALGHFVTRAVYRLDQKKHRQAKTFM